MTIQKKLLFLILGTFIALGIGLGVFLYFYLPIQEMEKEKSVLVELGSNLRDLRSEIGRIDNAGYARQLDKIRNNKDIFIETFNKLDDLKVLPEADEEIARAIKVIYSLQVLFQENWNAFDRTADEMTVHIQNILLSDTSIANAYRMNRYASNRVRESGELDQAILLWEKLISHMGIVDTNLLSAQEIIDKQFGLIDKNTQSIKVSSISFGLIIMGLICIATFFLAYMVSRSIARNIIAIEQGIERLKEGDLTVSVTVKSRDELGRLSSNLMEFVEELKGSMTDIKSSAGDNSLVKDDLTAVVAATSDEARSIGTSTAQINGIIDTLNGSIENSGQAVENMIRNVENLEQQVLEQMAMVEESTSAVTEMIASIGSVTEITERKGEATANLVRTAEAGGAQLGQTTRIIGEINDFVDEISGTAAVIQTVASQTNILAMNAAIEAAHAGEAGRGFAVVADEIRNLAETASNNSKRISRVLKEVVAKIAEASEAGRTTQRAFADINQEVDGVSEGLQEISGSMNELNTGSRQILQAMTQLQEVSVAVKHGSAEMGTASEKLQKGTREVQEISGEVKAGTLEIQESIQGIAGAMDRVNQMTLRLDEVTELLNREVSRFITDASENAAAAGEEMAEQVHAEPASLEEVDEDVSQLAALEDEYV